MALFTIKFVPKSWRLGFLLLAGTLVGLVLFLIHISRFFSYLSDSPNTCMNCHIMGPEYATWFHSSHREHATCNDCHVPQNNIFEHYLFKAQDGARHSFIFTMGTYQQAISIQEAGAKAVQGNCIRCHSNLFRERQKGGPDAIKYFLHEKNIGRRCWDCHQEVPHGSVRSLSSTPYARVPTTTSMIPEWLQKMLAREQQERQKRK